MVSHRVTDILHSVDWDFADVPANTGLHAIHPYPAKFIPQIPRQLIQLFDPEERGVLLDPFCGSGTTLVEAINAGREACGVDLNPLACLISRVKTTPLPCALDTIAKQVTARAQELLSSETLQVPCIPRLDHWFKPDIQKALAVLIREISHIPSCSTREALQVALSSIIVRVSNQESDTRYAAVEKNASAHEVFGQFKRATSSLHQAITLLSDNLFRRLGTATVLNRDILTVTPDELPRNVGLVVTSPPYPNAYEYWLYHKYRMYWLGMDPIEVRQREIGARPHYFRKQRQDESDFERQMSICFRLLFRVMLPGAKACFLVGRSIIHGRTIDNVALLQRAAQPYGFVTEGVISRRIPVHRKTFNPLHGKIRQEHILVFALQTQT
jgi:DNA modification methylase